MCAKICFRTKMSHKTLCETSLWYLLVTIALLGDFCEIVILRKTLGENAYKIYQINYVEDSGSATLK